MSLTAQERVVAARKAKVREQKRVRALVRQERIEEYEIEKLGRVGGTSQTLQRLEAHAIDRLQGRGVITAEQAHALEEMARAYAILTWDVEVRLSQLEKVDHTGRQGSDMPSAVRLLRRYTKWWDRLKQYNMQPCHPVAIDVAVDGLSLNAIAKKRHIDKRTVKTLLLDAIDMWVDVGRKRSD